MKQCYACFKAYDRRDGSGPCPHCGYDDAEQLAKYPLALRPGSILNGRYIVGRVLGQGGFGITYIAWDDKARNRVAIKEFFPAEHAGRTSGNSSVQVHSGELRELYEHGKEQFLSEAKTLASFMGNEHIVRIHSYFEENNTAYFAMEYVEGESLDKYMKRCGGRLSPETANALLFPVMDALDWVHSKGIIHRDIAPDNVLVKADGTAKLIDFGAARYSTGEKSKSLDVILKHGFAPKEQYMRRGRQGAFTDVYAMAATYYYAITGKIPPEALQRIDEDELIEPSTMGVKMPGKAEDVLIKALEVSAQDRYQTMGEFKAALQTEMPEVRPMKNPPLKIVTGPDTEGEVTTNEPERTLVSETTKKTGKKIETKEKVYSDGSKEIIITDGRSGRCEITELDANGNVIRRDYGKFEPIDPVPKQKQELFKWIKQKLSLKTAAVAAVLVALFLLAIGLNTNNKVTFSGNLTADGKSYWSLESSTIGEGSVVNIHVDESEMHFNLSRIEQLENRKAQVETLVISGNVYAIVSNTFSDYKNLKTVYLPESLTSIDSNAFLGCDNLSAVFYSGGRSQWIDINIAWGNDSLKKASTIYNAKYETNALKNSGSEELYQKACELMDAGESLEAYKTFLNVKNIPVEAEIIQKLKASIYSVGASAYRAKNYDKAEEHFSAIRDYKQSDDYLFLINYVFFDNTMYTYETSEDAERLVSLVGFADANEMIAKSSVALPKFLVGRWENRVKDYYFELRYDSETEYSSSHNLPIDVYNADHFEIFNGIYHLNQNGENIACYRFSIKDEDTITIYCYKDKKTYTLNRIT